MARLRGRSKRGRCRAAVPLHWSETINVAGRDWHIVVTPATGSAFAQFLWKPWAILLAGLLFTALLAQHLNSNRRRAAYIDNLVAERTAKLRKTAEGLARSNAELEQFAYVASHDLQEPLRKVQAFSDRMRSKYETVLDEQGLDYLSRMHHAAKRMQTLVNDLLSYSRVATKVEKFAPIDLDIVVQEVIADLETRIEETGAQIEVANMPTIDAVPSQMRQLFQNLIANSLKYHRNEVAPEVKITGDIIENGAIEPNGTSSKTCQITVRDNGLGFEAQYAERIFGIFQRLHGRVEFEGTVVGLAVCRKIAERHDGTIRAQGRPGEGSTFTVTLPLQHQSPEQV